MKSLNIAVLARGLSEPVGGVKHYIEDILKALPQADSHNRYFYYLNQTFPHTLPPNVFQRVIPQPSKLLFDHWCFPRALKKDAIDLVFCPKNVIPIGVTQPAVVSIHDLLYFAIPGKAKMDEYHFLDKCYMRAFIPRALQKATAVQAISQNTADDIATLFPRYAHKVHPIHLATSGFALEPMNDQQRDTYLDDLNVPRPYIFYSGTNTLRKNLRVLIRALGQIRDSLPHHLVVTGGGAERDLDLDQELAEARLHDRFQRLGKVSQKQLAALYRGADMFVFPSLYEGFGLPVLEAMACGSPVICSNASAMPEVYGDAALAFDPHHPDQLAQHILRLSQDHALRAQLIQKGHQRAAQMSYQKTARALVSLFQAVAQNRD